MREITLSVPDELYEQIERLAADMKRSVEQCSAWALEDFVTEERPKVDADLQGERDFSEGRYVTQEDMEAWANSLDTAHPLPAPQPNRISILRAS